MSIIDDLIYDRTNEDLETARNYIKNNQALPNDNLRYAWDYRALNRTEEAMEYVNEIFKELGYFKNMTFKKDWFADEITPEQAQRYISNLKVLRDYLTMPNTTPVVPNTINGMSIEKANDIEKILYDIDVVLEALQNNYIYCGVCNLGQDRIWQQRFRRKPYTKVEYLKSNASQYVDTGVVGTINTKIEIMFSTFERGSYGQQPFGVLTPTTKAITFNLTTNSGSATRYGDKAKWQAWDINLDTKYKLVVSSDGYYLNDEPIWRPNADSFTTERNMCLFRAAGSSAGLRGNIYYCKIYENNVLVRDFIPVLNNIGTPCMLDRVENKFYYNQGTGNFIAGT